MPARRFRLATATDTRAPVDPITTRCHRPANRLRSVPMSSEQPALASVVPPRRHLGVELVLVILVSFAVLVPGIQKYSLVDPWETHYGEVGRMMLQEHDLVHMQWPGGQSPTENEGFRS